MRKKAYYWESMEYNGDDTVEFRDIIPIEVGFEENYVFDAMLYIDGLTWDEYDENESYEWSFIIYEDGMYEWGEYYATFYGTQAEAEMWGVDMEGKFEDDYERGVIEPQGDYDY